MADTTILASKIVLQDTVQGEVNPNMPQPTGGFTGSSHHNVAVGVFDLTTKVQVYDETAKGNSVFVYLKNGTQTDIIIAAGSVMIPAGATQNSALATYIFTNDPDDGIVGGPAVVALSAMTDDYYGWFWCGGVAPVGITNSGITSTTTIKTDDSVVAGLASSGDLTANCAGLKIATTLKIIAGTAMAADG
jgi:hypothetical protein